MLEKLRPEAGFFLCQPAYHYNLQGALIYININSKGDCTHLLIIIIVMYTLNTTYLLQGKQYKLLIYCIEHYSNILPLKVCNFQHYQIHDKAV